MSLIGRTSEPAPRSRAAISSSAKREISYSTLTVRSTSSKEIFRTPYTSLTHPSADIWCSAGGTRYRKTTSISVMVKPASCHLANRTSRWFTKEAYATIEAIRSPSLANFDSSSISMLRRLRTAPAKSSRGCGDASVQAQRLGDDRAVVPRSYTHLRFPSYWGRLSTGSLGQPSSFILERSLRVVVFRVLEQDSDSSWHAFRQTGCAEGTHPSSRAGKRA